MLFYPLYEVAKRCDCKMKLFHDPTVFDIQYSLLQNNIFKQKDNQFVVFRNAQVILQFSGAVSEFIIEDLYDLTTNTDL
jgi:hypothetical protein